MRSSVVFVVVVVALATELAVVVAEESVPEGSVLVAVVSSLADAYHFAVDTAAALALCTYLHRLRLAEASLATAVYSC